MAQSNSCRYANDGECDEPGTWAAGAASGVAACSTGTDFTDCNNACRYRNDNACDEPAYCRTGTDCSDCGNCGGSPSSSSRTCSRGEYLSSGSCRDCASGRYQSSYSHSDSSCDRCPSGKTSSSGADSSSDCYSTSGTSASTDYDTSDTQASSLVVTDCAIKLWCAPAFVWLPCVDSVHQSDAVLTLASAGARHGPVTSLQEGRVDGQI
jgi:hypothetical protein